MTGTSFSGLGLITSDMLSEKYISLGVILSSPAKADRIFNGGGFCLWQHLHSIGFFYKTNKQRNSKQLFMINIILLIE